MLYLLLVPLALYGLTLGLRYLLTFLHLRKLRIQSPEYRLIAASQVPAYLKTLFQTPLAELKSFGFKPCCYVQIRGLAKTEPASLISLLLYHPGHKTYATLGVKLLAEAADLFEIDFYSLFTDQTLLLTLNGRAYGVVGQIPQVILQDPYAVDTATQWQMHEQTLGQLDKTACGLAPDRFVAVLQARLHQYIDHLLQTQRVRKADPGLLRLTLPAIWRQTGQSLRGMSKYNQLLQRRRRASSGPVPSPAAAPIEIPVEIEVQSYQRMEFLQRDLLGRKFRSWMLWISLALFLITYTQLFNSQTFGLFIAALLLHEGGHLLAMKLFGYRDLALLFLPFLGALATAHKQDASLSQKFWISLAGPLPGLLLGLALLAFTTQQQLDSGWLIEAGWILIGLNLFNLLPIYPLDGGQIADLLLFSRHPYVGVGFKGLGVLLLALLGLGQPMLLLFAGLIALGIPTSFRAAKLTMKLRQPLSTVPAEDSEALRLIFETLKQQGHGRLPFAQRYSLAKNLLLSRRELQATGLARLGLGLVYSFSLGLGLVGAAAALLPLGLPWGDPGQALLSRYQSEQQRQIDQATEALVANPHSLDAYKQRALARTNLQDQQGALADYNQILRLAPQDTEARLRRAMYRSLTGDHAAAIQDYDLILHQDAQNQEALHARAQSYMLLQNYRKALADYSTLIQLAPADSWLYLERGHVRQELRDYRGALADANAVLRLEPAHPDAYQLRSEARRSLGDLSGAEADQQQASRLAETWTE